ncbi:hypothetical protein AU490_12125 [Lonsdalea populi]|uniref:DUF6971 domain-containing protein n=1 Tax=Lonsdalea populi TaxID=1172565 RepID=A0A3N0UTN7_9GAMM|nr:MULTISPECIES: hypothetical protein [Lonsdalea]OSM98613.1 hypothetical protein AU499_12645 [Lonsdalea populi]QPQ23642.1 hypothetical protein I6N93_13690 [Lonsdalea populi]RAT16788.1 hypothetical protein AU486_06885 [Lonsdalea quercina]RAT27266.1 hypothetical protein AU490_12125 [Lonsdalea populi]RAT30044.1 hypothetical protein AU491_16030 [Lonsdalea populi]
MSINPKLPTMGIVDQKVTLSKDLKTVLYIGQEIPTEHFIKVTVPSLLGYYAPGSGGANSLLSELSANGFSITGFSRHHQLWADYIRRNREEQARRELEAKQHRERMAALMATPEEIAEAVAQRKAREAELEARFGARGKSAAFGDL